MGWSPDLGGDGLHIGLAARHLGGDGLLIGRGRLPALGRARPAGRPEAPGGDRRAGGHEPGDGQRGGGHLQLGEAHGGKDSLRQRGNLGRHRAGQGRAARRDGDRGADRGSDEGDGQRGVDRQGAEQHGRRGAQAATLQAVAEHRAGPEMTTLDRAKGPGEPTGSLLVRAARQVAEDDRDAVGLGQGVDLALDGRGQVAAHRLLDASRAGGGRVERARGPLAAAAGRGRGAGLRGDAAGDDVEPVGQQVAVPERAGFFTRIRKVAWKASSASAPSPRARRQTPRTIGPCRATSAANAASSPGGDEAVQELPLGEARDGPLAPEPPDLADGRAQAAARRHRHALAAG